MASEFTWNTFVLLLKGGYEYCGIGLVGFSGRPLPSSLTYTWVDAIKFHDVLHRFRAWRGTETATPESKLLHNIVGMQKEVLYEIFVDTQKYYDAMD